MKFEFIINKHVPSMLICVGVEKCKNPRCYHYSPHKELFSCSKVGAECEGINREIAICKPYKDVTK